MIRFLLFVLVAASAQAGPWGRLVQPDGSAIAVAVTSDRWGATFTFPRGSVPARAWLALPPGSISEAVMVTADRKTVVPLPSVHAPGMRVAVAVPAGLLWLSLRGTPGDAPLRLLAARPSGTGWVTAASGEVRIALPDWQPSDTVAAVALRRQDSSSWSATVSDHDAERTFEMSPAVRDWTFFPDAWGLAARQITIRAPEAGRFDLRVGTYGSEADLPVDPRTLLAWPPDKWRSPQHEWFSWAGTSVLVLVSATYAVQDAFLKRLAFFVEKTGYRGRLVSDAEVAHLHGWNAHDYQASDLARFFSLAASQQFPLNRAEIELRDRLAGAGIIKEGPGGWEAGTGALLGISAESPPALRSVLFVHEAFHGLYYTSEAFRSGVKAAWAGMSEDTRAAFRSFLARSRYDPDDEALMINEFQAYVLQRRQTDWPGFFRERVLSEEHPRTAARLAELLKAARAVDAVVTRLYGLHSGEVSLLEPSSP